MHLRARSTVVYRSISATCAIADSKVTVPTAAFSIKHVRDGIAEARLSLAFGGLLPSGVAELGPRRQQISDSCELRRTHRRRSIKEGLLKYSEMGDRLDLLPSVLVTGASKVCRSVSPN